MDQQIVNSVMREMKDCLDNQQLLRLKMVLENAIHEKEQGEDNSQELLDLFISTKRC